jgi:hypothetical protein
MHWLILTNVLNNPGQVERSQRYAKEDVHGKIKRTHILIKNIPLRLTTESRWHDDKIAMVRWWKHDGTMVKTQWNDGKDAMIRWWRRDVTMMKTVLNIVLYHRTIVFSPSYHRRVFIIFTIVPPCLAGKDEIKNYDCPNGTPFIPVFF